MKSKAPKPAPPTTPRPAVVLAAVAAVAVVAVIAWQLRSHDATSSPSGSSSAAASASADGLRTTLAASASPPDAVFFIDDLPLEGNPYKGAFPRDGHAHRVRAEAKGHIARTDVVVFDKDDVAVTLTLQARQRIQAIDSDGRPVPDIADAAAP